MMRLEERSLTATYHRWQPDDGTSYELVILDDPHGGWRLWWRNGRSSRKGQEPAISSYWTDRRGFHGMRDQLARSMHLVAYDAEALAVFLSELGHCASPGIGDLRKFPLRLVRR
jgi:hypothetical protein